MRVSLYCAVFYLLSMFINVRHKIFKIQRITDAFDKYLFHNKNTEFAFFRQFSSKVMS